MQYSVSFPGGTVRYMHNSPFSGIGDVVDPARCIVITDSNVAGIYGAVFQQFKATIVIPQGEDNKNFATVLTIVQQLLQHQAHRGDYILGIGGGMVTDIAGFVASVYMRGISFGYVPTTLLGMVDAAIGGKNGINIGMQKNLLGTIRQPEFILFDHHFLDTLPAEEWSNGFAEIIKYACLFDEAMFRELQQHDLQYYRNDYAAISALIAKCVDWKNKIVLADEREQGMRKLLNFGHTAGHAFETVCHIPHGQAVALGMLVACRLSEEKGLTALAAPELAALLQRYNLPVHIKADTDALMNVLAMDKKRDSTGIDYIILEAPGKGAVRHVTLDDIRKVLKQFTYESDNTAG